MFNNSTIEKEEKLSGFQKLLIGFLLLLGFLFLIVSEHIHEYNLWKLILHLLGAFLIIAIPIELIREYFFEEVNRKSFVDAVDQLFDKKIDAQLIQARKFGLERIEELPIERLFDCLKEGDTLWWLDTFCPGQKRWINHVKQAIERGAIINMLILDPESSSCEMRATELCDEFAGQGFKDELKLFITAFKDLQERIRKSRTAGDIHISFYSGLLGVPCYIVEKDGHAIYAYSSMYLSAATGVSFPHFLWEKGDMCEMLLAYVRKKWDSATQYKKV